MDMSKKNDTSLAITSDSSLTISGNVNITVNKKYTHGVYIGRFQPFHLGHLHLVEHALNLAEKLIIVVGSHNKPRDWKNPWTSAERIDMIKASLTDEQRERVYFQTVEDRLYTNKEWQASIYEAVDAVLLQYSKYRIKSNAEGGTAKICLVGFNKDDSSSYQKWFPEFALEEAPMYNMEEGDDVLSATMLREMVYENHVGSMRSHVPAGAFAFIKEWLKTENAQYVKDWYVHEGEYQKPYETLPYGTNFYTADSVVFQGNHVLMGKRKFHPGKGLWALPGGHVNKNELALEASVRELYEETKLKVPEKVLLGSFIGEKLFDHPDRSLRGRLGKKVGRTVSISHCFELSDEAGIPRTTPADDLEETWFFTISEIRAMRNEIFEDHADQIEYWIPRLNDKKYR
jgi:bifunctional NMN adenylyltransferase/nudix hydrolase